jgi:hypothetical protein
MFPNDAPDAEQLLQQPAWQCRTACRDEAATCGSGYHPVGGDSSDAGFCGDPICAGTLGRWMSDGPILEEASFSFVLQLRRPGATRYGA